MGGRQIPRVGGWPEPRPRVCGVGLLVLADHGVLRAHTGFVFDRYARTGSEGHMPPQRRHMIDALKPGSVFREVYQAAKGAVQTHSREFAGWVTPNVGGSSA